MEQWYRVVAARTRQGAGKYVDTVNYVYANDAGQVLERFRKMPGVKKGRIPRVMPLTREESTELEKRIMDTNFNLERAKATWFYGTRSD